VASLTPITAPVTQAAPPPDAQAKKSPLLAALQAELERSMKTLRAQDPPAYYLGYTITDTQRADVSGSNGALLNSGEAVTDLAELQLGSFAGDLEDVLGLRCEGDNRINNRRGFPERVGIGTDSFFPRFAVQRKRNLRANVGVRLLVREIGRTVFDRIHFYFFARLDLDEGFRGGAVLAVGLQPHGAAENAGIIIEWNRFARAGGGLRPFANLMGVIRFVAARAQGT